jgi:CheY-like chemotaxis protein
MSDLAMGLELGLELCERLRLDPSLVSAIDLRFEMGEPVTVMVEMFLTKSAESFLSQTFTDWPEEATRNHVEYYGTERVL